MTDTLPSGVILGTATADQGTGCTGTSTITCSLGSLANAASATVTIIITPEVAASLSNNATITGDATDPSMGDNSVSETTTVNPAVLTTTNVEPESLVAGAVGEVDVSFTLANALVTGGKIVVTFPSGFTLSSGAATGIGTDGTSFDGTESVTVSGDSVTVTRSGGS